MIGIYQNLEQIIFCVPGKEGTFRYAARKFDAERPRPEQVAPLFNEARAELGFSAKDDFRLVVDFPLSYCVAQAVPFAEKQLPQILENYLEEELPDDIDRYAFDYRVLSTKEDRSSVLAFWIEKETLRAWTNLTEEQSLNSLDVQPAELALLPPPGDPPRLTLHSDHDGALRYSLLMIKDLLPCLALGRLPGAEGDPAKVARILRFTGTRWNEVERVEAPASLAKFAAGVASSLGIARVETLAGELDAYFFCRWASGATLETGRPTQLLNFRKGEFAQRGLHEKVLLPAVLIALAAIFFLEAHAYYHRVLAKREKAHLEAAQQAKTKVWTKLFPKEPSPPSRMREILMGRQSALTEGEADDKLRSSALQSMGLLFKYINIPNSENLLITEINISDRSVSMGGTAKTVDDVGVLNAGFKNQSDFNTPETSHHKVVDKTAGEYFTFRFNTALKDAGKKP